MCSQIQVIFYILWDQEARIVISEKKKKKKILKRGLQHANIVLELRKFQIGVLSKV